MYLNNIFGEIPERNVTFVIDSSGSMYDVLAIVKDHIIETLIERAYNRPDTSFNIIDFNSEITEWADRMVECTPITVNAAMRWLRGIETRTGSNVKTAVKMAFDEPRCDAVYLVTDGFTDQDSNRIVRSVTKKAYGRPVHCITVSDQSVELPATARTFLESLAINTRGSYHIVYTNRLGDVAKVSDVFNATYVPIEGEKRCSIDTQLNYNPYKHVFPGGFPLTTARPLSPVAPLPHYRYYPYVNTEALKEEVLHSPVASVVARGTRVLARRDKDGFYYTAHIAQEIQGNRNKFLIEFDRLKKKRDYRMQETFFHDVIAYNDALRHSVVADDKVLAPWESNSKRYGPGKVIRGIEKRNRVGDHSDSDLLVTFWNGVTRTVEKGTAIWIPERLYDRIVLELQMPISARKELIENRDPHDLAPGYPSLSRNEDLFDDALWDPLMSIRRQLLYYPWLYNGLYYLPTYPLLTPAPRLLRSWPSLIFQRPDLYYGSWPWPHYDETTLPFRRRYPITRSNVLEGTDVTKEHLREMVDQQLRDHDQLEDEKKKLEKLLRKSKKESRRRRSRSRERRRSVSSCSSSDELGSEHRYKSTMVDVATTTKPSHLREYRRTTQRPEWKKYWPQTPQPRQHRSPEFERRRPGMYSTWDDMDTRGGVNASSLYHQVDRAGAPVRSDRAKLIEHLRTPYVEMHDQQTSHVPRMGRRDFDLEQRKGRIQHLGRREQSVRAHAWAQREDDAYNRSKLVEDTKRREAIMRIGSEVERQREYEKQISDTIEAKAKINQSFRDTFYRKELDNLNRQQERADWLQQRRRHHATREAGKAVEAERVEHSRALGRQYRLARHHDLNVRRSASACK